MCDLIEFSDTNVYISLYKKKWVKNRETRNQIKEKGV